MTSPTTSGQRVAGKERMESWQQEFDTDYGWVCAESKEDGRVVLRANGKQIWLSSETVEKLTDWLSTTPRVAP